uniref:Phosphatidylinositol-3,4,5-trisphosphate 3-phosphatase n=1 Tax=Amorphochlora amoebiformis TaxID=1561963 RepID=A0A7S0DCT9_9EUKA|mmetsp:Transcript_23461/g.36856  ORF Transcript_23461/g.36856 Transcript_23461/m.36856 type:complete len:931 (+) Transcript_23461:166-2958(+)
MSAVEDQLLHDSMVFGDGAVQQPHGKPIKQGWLKKKSPKGFGGFRQWQARYFILYSNQLLYYKKENDRDPAGRVHFSMIEKILKGDKFESEHRIDIVCIHHNAKRGKEKRKFCLRAYNQEDGERWYQDMVNVALKKDRASQATRQGTLGVSSPGVGALTRQSIADSILETTASPKIMEQKLRRPGQGRRITKIKQDMLGQIALTEELVSGSPDLGSVYKARIGTTSRRFLLQMVPKTDEELTSKMQPVFTVERRSLKCRFIMPVVAVGQTRDTSWILYDYGGNYSLFRHLRRIGAFPEAAVRTIIAQILLSIDDIHKKDYTCWNLSPETIFLDGEGNVLLCDLQLAVAPEDLKSLPIDEYTAPESLQNQIYSPASDWWRIGVLMYELMLGVPPTWTPTHDAKAIQERVIDIARNGVKSFPVNISNEAKALIKLLLSPLSTRSNLSFETVAAAPFFKGLNFARMGTVGRDDFDEWWEQNICSYCECTYTTPRQEAVVPVENQLSMAQFFEGVKVPDEKYDQSATTLSFEDIYTPKNNNNPITGRKVPPPPPPEEKKERSSSTTDRKSFTNIIRGVVSKNFKRYQADGYDLDLSYITPRIIAMGSPSTGEGVQKNPLADIKKLFQEKHKSKIKVYNLCTDHVEKNFANQANYPIEDHNPCTLRTLLAFCQDVDSWRVGIKNAIAVHCNTGKGRTGMAIAAYLTFKRICANANEALKFFAEKRTKDMKGVTIPSQRRFVFLFEEFLKVYYWPRPAAPMFQWRKPIILQHVRLSPVPNYVAEGCDPYFRIFREGKELMYSSVTHNRDQKRYNKKSDKTIEFLCNCNLAGDYKITFYDRDPSGTGDDTMFWFWFNTSFINLDYLVLTKEDLDGAVANKKNFDTDFLCELFFLPNNSDIRKMHRTLTEVEMKKLSSTSSTNMTSSTRMNSLNSPRR